MGCNKSSSKREVYSNTILPQETRKTLTRQHNFTPKTTGKRRTKKPKISRRKDIINIRAEINEKEMKETIAKINKTKSWFFENHGIFQARVQEWGASAFSCGVLILHK